MRGEAAARVVTDAFNEVALLIGGAAAVNDLPDELLWRLLRSLERARRRLCHRLSIPEGDHEAREVGPLPTHPAVEEFLSRSRGAGRA
jgi:hypothetical protein